MHTTYVHRSLQDADFTLNAIVDISTEGFWDWKAETMHVVRSPGWYRMLGYDLNFFEETVFTWENIIHPDDYERVMDHFEAYVNGKSDLYKIQYRCKKSDGSYLWIEDCGKIVAINEDGTVARMIGKHTDIHALKTTQEELLLQNKLLRNDNMTLENLVTERTMELNILNHKLQEQIEASQYNMMHDMLTKLYNRQSFETLLKKEISRSTRYHYPLCIALLDIDDFKKINDTYGHKTGDAVLIRIAQLLEDNIRESDIAARWGGEELIIIFPETVLEDCTHKAEHVREAIANEPFPFGQVTCSFGVASYKSDETPDRLFVRCDDALYQAKNNGKNNICIAV